MRAAIFGILVGLVAIPAQAATLGFSGVARIYCDAVVSGRMDPVLELLTEELRELVGDQGALPVVWQGEMGPVETCMPVGNRGTKDRPETIVVFGAAGRPGVSQTIVMVWVDDALAIDDITFADGETLRERLTDRA